MQKESQNFYGQKKKSEEDSEKDCAHQTIAYADLILNSDPAAYPKAVTEYKSLD